MNQSTSVSYNDLKKGCHFSNGNGFINCGFTTIITVIL